MDLRSGETDHPDSAFKVQSAVAPIDGNEHKITGALCALVHRRTGIRS